MKVKSNSELSKLQEQVRKLQEELSLCKDREIRAIADYQNLQKRTHEEKSKMTKMAGLSLVGDLLQPLEHLSLAAAQLNDVGLNMVVDQLWQKLAENGLERIEVLGRDFDIQCMEVVETASVDAKKVTQEVRPGFRFNGYVIQHAKVILG